MAKFRIEDITPPRKRVGTKRVIPDAEIEDEETLHKEEKHIHKAHHPHDELAASAPSVRKTSKHSTHKTGASPERHIEISAPELSIAPPEELHEEKILTGADRFKNFFTKEEQEDVQEEEPEAKYPSEEADPPQHYAYADDDRDPTRYDTENRRGMDWGKWVPWLVGFFIFIVGGLVLADTVFSHGTITVIPKSEVVTVPNTITAYKDPEAGALGFSVMKIELSDTRNIPATGSKQVSSKASGKVVIYNDYNTKPQRLIKNTRFQSPSGKIYRITDSVNVPGQKTVNGKTMPGTLEVTIYADEPGDAYNTQPTDFTIPGFTGDPRHEKVYARSSTPITGGAAGLVKTVSDDGLKRAKEDLRVSLETKLRTKARADIAPTQIGFDTGIFIELAEPVVDSSSGDASNATIQQTGTLYAIVFDRTQLAHAVAKLSLPKYNGEDVSIANLELIPFETAPQKGSILWDAEKLEFSLNGPAELRFGVDTSALRRDLAGIEKTRFNDLMTAYPSISRATAEVRPPWKAKFPSDPDRITVVVAEPGKTPGNP